MDQKKLEDRRKNYSSRKLDKTMVKSNPIEQFKDWFQEAVDIMGNREPNAMTLATATSDGLPSARVVLLKGVSEKGFVFYTNYKSRKGKEVTANPNAALVFFWEPLERQVRIEGTLTQMSQADSERYFQTRPKKSQIGAHVSQQSAVIEDRTVMEQEAERLTEHYKDEDVLPCPEHWGGLVLKPTSIEFWQGRPNRLHDRLWYVEENGVWQLKRLAP